MPARVRWEHVAPTGENLEAGQVRCEPDQLGKQASARGRFRWKENFKAKAGPRREQPASLPRSIGSADRDWRGDPEATGGGQTPPGCCVWSPCNHRTEKSSGCSRPNLRNHRGPLQEPEVPNVSRLIAEATFHDAAPPQRYGKLRMRIWNARLLVVTAGRQEQLCGPGKPPLLQNPCHSCGQRQSRGQLRSKLCGDRNVRPASPPRRRQDSVRL
jgi:hypothetical protein